MYDSTAIIWLLKNALILLRESSKLIVVVTCIEELTESMISKESCQLTATLIQEPSDMTGQCAKTFSVAHCSCNQDTEEHLEHIRFSVHQNIMTKLLYVSITQLVDKKNANPAF